jgi:hypothetical protein
MGTKAEHPLFRLSVIFVQTAKKLFQIFRTNRERILGEKYTDLLNSIAFFYLNLKFLDQLLKILECLDFSHVRKQKQNQHKLSIAEITGKL